MNPLDALMNPNPPAKMKVFAPNGDTKKVTCWVGIRNHLKHSQLTELFLLFGDGTTEVLNKKVVVQNLETEMVVYDPRRAPSYFGQRVFMTGPVTRWLEDHPDWPRILELDNNPVDNEEESEGLYNG
jgi:hypothetical protein